MTKAVELHRLWNALESLGITLDDAQALRRISMTLHRWHELECGEGNSHGSWCITRGTKAPNGPFTPYEEGAPYLEHHHYTHGRGKDSVSYRRIPDREAGARKRLATIMARYPELQAYVQTDPRGWALYILKQGDISEGLDVSSCYSRGIAVHR